ncbi:heme-binding protein [Alicyclobacillus sp. SO9]|uniref:GlcG/HbpS family heme-binding protein n=1 Tax=Alicyclobacillus sp. SO9 TaxID=2665646 RepID=UPI0018E8FCD0|nr:heme-binding protein [Alicyclobacillus sp. SO9]QQE78658.1 heme-binding protein [Alicyclobacillus sp. SO9]
MKKTIQLETAEARTLIAAAEEKSSEIEVAETIAVVDAGGHLIALERMDGARITGPEIAIAKAFTAAGHRRATHLFNKPPNGPVLPNNEAYGIQLMFPGRFAVFVGGFPIVIDNEVVGGLGISGGNGKQDTAVGLAALEALAESLASEGYEVTAEADIKM